ncbi:aldo/keto reductase [Pseudomonas putida S11]|nr:aldo/keto reductase [Pseudomonas putida S11]
MIYRPLGHSGLQVSALTLGSMMFGEQTSTEDALRIIDKAWDQGINFIDTADVYNAGRAEEIVGEAVARHRHDWIVASKVGFGPADGLPNRSGLSRKHIFNALDATLTRMDMDYLDIYYLHREDHKVPLEETVQAIGDLLRQGKIRYWGVSNFRGWRIAEACHIAERLGVPRPVVSQPLYNIVNRQAEPEQLTAAAAHGLGVVPFSPLARGVLSGKYAPGAVPDAGSRAGRQDKRIMEVEWRQESLAIARQIQAYVEAKGVGIVEFAIALGTEQSAGQFGDCRAADRRTVGIPMAGRWRLRLPRRMKRSLIRWSRRGMPRRRGSNDVAHYVSGRLARS